MKKSGLQKLILTALFVALRVILERFLSYNTWNQRFGLSFVAVAAAAVLLGPIASTVVAGLGDIIGALLFPTGAFFPGFTLTALLIGFSTGFFLYKDGSALRIISCVLINQIFGSILLNSLWISILYGSPYWSSLPKRMFQAALMTAIQLLLDFLLFSNRSHFRTRLVRLRQRI